MKALKIITHPYTLITSFLLIIISGEHLGGFYALYILLALFYGGMHSLLGVSGVILLIVARNLKGKAQNSFSGILNIGGAIFMILSIIIFFYMDKDGYNYGTFHQTVPIISLILFGLLVLLFLSKNVVQTFIRKHVDTKVSF
jgi:hypothetical protein